MKKIICFLLLIPSFSFPQCFTKTGCASNNGMAIKQDGTLWGWGYHINQGQDELSPIQLGSSTDWSDVSFFTMIKTNGTMWTYAPDSGAFTQLGIDSDWQTVSCGFHKLALKNNHTLWAQGNNIYGQLGDGTNVLRNNFVQIGSDQWNVITAALQSSFGIKTDGTLWGWGLNNYGQLGDGTTVDKWAPTQIGTDSDWVSVASKIGFALALKSNGTIWAWGYNNAGQLGNGTTGVINGVPNENYNFTNPAQVGTDNDWVKVATSNQTSFALKQNGTMWSWGNDTSGVLGDGSTSSRNLPAQMGNDTDWTDIDTGHSFVEAMKPGGRLYAWGYNYIGQLGIGNGVSQSFPVQVSCTALGMDNFNKKRFAIYPNPATDLLNIDSQNFTIQKTTVMDMLGKKMLEQAGSASILNIAVLQQGIYILQINSEGKIFNYKFVKE